MPPTQQFDLNIAAVGNGSAMCDGKTVRNQSLSIKVTEGSSSSISLYPDTGYRVASIKVNGQDALSQVSTAYDKKQQSISMGPVQAHEEADPSEMITVHME